MIALWKKIKFKVSRAFTPRRLESAARIGVEAIEKAQLGLELQYIDGPEAEATSKISSAAAELIKSLEHVDSAVLRISSILVVKCDYGGSK